MRFKNKYKLLSKFNSLDSKISSRVLNFRRPKWQKIQKLLSRKTKKPNSFLKLKKKNLFSTSRFIKKKKKSWDKIKNHYNEGLKLKTIVDSFFDSSVSIPFYKKKNTLKIFTTQEYFEACMIRPEFRIDILLFRLNFFSSPFQARQSLNEGEILVNNIKIKGNTFLEKGDIITFSSKKSYILFSLKKILDKQISALNHNFCPFVEIDFYTKTIVIFKNIEEFTESDSIFLFSNHFDHKKFRDYI